jgi:UDP-glucuronate decarboxylase
MSYLFNYARPPGLYEILSYLFSYDRPLCCALVRLMKTSDNIIGPINLGNPDEFTILKLAEKVIELTDSKSEIIFKPLPADDPRQRQPDITLAREVLGWEPKVPLEEGLKKTISYFQGLLSSSFN